MSTKERMRQAQWRYCGDGKFLLVTIRLIYLCNYYVRFHFDPQNEGSKTIYFLSVLFTVLPEHVRGISPKEKRPLKVPPSMEAPYRQDILSQADNPRETKEVSVPIDNVN